MTENLNWPDRGADGSPRFGVCATIQSTEEPLAVAVDPR